MQSLSSKLYKKNVRIRTVSAIFANKKETKKKHRLLNRPNRPGHRFFFSFFPVLAVFFPVLSQTVFAHQPDRMQVRFPVRPVQPAGPVRF
jgi:hypothetical protein